MKHYRLPAATAMAVLILSTLHVKASTSTNAFDIVMVTMSPTIWSSIKYNTGTGAAWIAQNGKWLPLQDAEAIPEGEYVIKMTGLANDWAAIRFDVKTGQSWQCREHAWVEITHTTPEPAAEPATPKAAPAIKFKPR